MLAKAFEIMGKKLGIFDLDKIDIGRAGEKDMPDGTTIPLDPKIPIYTNVKCHLSYKTYDNTDTNTVGTRPIIIALQIDCPHNVDLQNNDHITAYKIDGNGNTLRTYKGIIGQPTMLNSRQTVIMAINESM